MGNFEDLRFVYCERAVAKQVCETRHYMRTYPQGAKVNIAIMDGKRVVGICVFGYSSATEQKVARIAYGISRHQYLEMQRLWISDDYGHNTESWSLARIIRKLHSDYDLKCIVTHAGGCKDDCGIVYQASGWLYFGSSKCDDFYLTEAGEYKNMVAALRFGRASAKGKTKQQVGEELFGPGSVVNAHRYFYVYPIDKAIRRRLTKVAQPYPKQSAVFRRDQQWVTPQGDAAGAGGSDADVVRHHASPQVEAQP
jgi:hypothetical protein